MSRKRTVSVNRFAEKVSRRAQPKTRYAAVTSVSSESPNFVNVITADGTPFQNVPSGFQLSAGAAVKLSVRGLAGSEEAMVERPVRLAPNASNGNPNQIIETPEIAGIYHHMRTLQGGIVVLVIVVVVWQIQDQWRDNRAVGYELEMRQVTENIPSQTLTIQPRGQMVASLESWIDDDDTTIPIATIGTGKVEGLAPDSGNQFPPRYGYIDIENETIFYDTYVLGDEFTGALRGQDTQAGSPTTAAAHDSGALVRGRSVAFSLENVPTENHEYRVRAVLAGNQHSNWSDWVIYKAPAVTPAETRTADLITNGTFDSNVTGWDLGGIFTGTLTHEPTVGLMGLGSAYLEDDGAGFPTNPQVFQDGISITAGNEYVVRGSMTIDGDVYPTDSFQLELAFNGFDSSFFSAKVMGDQMGTLDNNKWVMFEARGVAPYGTTEATIRLHAILSRGVGEQARVYIDDVRMWEVPNVKNALSEEAVETDSLRIGGGGTLTGLPIYETTWNPPSLGVGASALNTVTGIPGIATGDGVIPSLTSIGGNDMDLRATVTLSDTGSGGNIFVILTNHEAGTVDLGSGTLRLFILKGTA